MNISMLVAASAGLLSFLSPCVLPLVPSYLAFVAGASFGDLRGRPDRAVRKVVVLNALDFIIGCRTPPPPRARRRRPPRSSPPV